MDTPAQLGLSGWHGLTWHPVTVIGETPTKYRIRLEEAVRLPGGREKAAQEVVLVPKQAVRFSRPVDTPKTPETSPSSAFPRDWQALREAVSVETLARAWYGEPDPRKSTRTTLQWNTDQGRLIVGRHDSPRAHVWKFMDSGLHGRGALDWLTRVGGIPLHEAVDRLSQDSFRIQPDRVLEKTSRPGTVPQYVPHPDQPTLWPKVRHYLITVRKLPADLVDHWHAQDRVRAITPSPRTTVPYAVFPLLSPAGKEIGAILRCAGTPDQQHQQEAQGYCRKRNQGGSQPTHGFWQSHEASQARTLVLVEAPIDAMALYAALRVDHRDPGDFVIRAGAGEALNPVHWTGDWEHIVTAFDRDAAGERFHQTVQQANLDRDVRRLTPPVGHKDWAEAWAKVLERHPRDRDADSPAHRGTRIRSRGADIEYEPGD